MTDETTPPAPSSSHSDETIQRLSVQLKKLTEANNKYKNILKLARDRIQAQEDELSLCRTTNSQLQAQLEEKELEIKKAATTDGCNQRRDAAPADVVTLISNVHQRVKVGENEIWAIVEFRVFSEESPQQHNRKYKEWVCFNSESQLEDYIRRDTGEPLTLPPYSLTPDQSARMEHDAEQRVSKVTEEFRRFRVKSELARKQAEAQIRELQSAKHHTAAQDMDDHRQQQDICNGRGVVVSQQQLERLKAEMATQEAYWKESYETLLAENNALKESGSEALLASQWRQRYETCKIEKEALEQTLKTSPDSSSSLRDAEKYEQKYRDLKESFRLYRKKAKEIFEAQQQTGNGGGLSSAEAIHITSHSSADARLSYLKNLMLNYLTADPTVRDHMETAIGTVLQFSQEEKKLVDLKKTAAIGNSWF